MKMSLVLALPVQCLTLEAGMPNTAGAGCARTIMHGRSPGELMYARLNGADW